MSESTIFSLAKCFSAKINLFYTGPRIGNFIDGITLMLLKGFFSTFKSASLQNFRLYFFEHCLSKIISTFRMLISIPKLCLVPRNSNFIRRSCQKFRIFMNRVYKRHRTFSKHPDHILLSWSQAPIFHLQNNDQSECSWKSICIAMLTNPSSQNVTED